MWTPEPVWTTWKEFLALPGVELRSLRRPTRSQLLDMLPISLRKMNSVAVEYKNKQPTVQNGIRSLLLC
jgi:hypothetical protein